MDENIIEFTKELIELEKKYNVGTVGVFYSLEDQQTCLIMDGVRQLQMNALVNCAINDPNFRECLSDVVAFVENKISESPDIVPNEEEYSDALIDTYLKIKGEEGLKES